MPTYKIYIPTSVLQGQTYAQKMQALFGSSLIAYWPLWEPSGVTAADIKAGLNGTYKNTAGTLSGVTLGQAGIGDGRTAALFNGTQGNVNVYSAGLNSVFSGALGGIMMWVKFPVAVWSDNAQRDLFYFAADASNTVTIERPVNQANQLSFIYIAGGTNKSLNNGSGFFSTQWMRLGFFWNKAGDHTSVYVNGYKFQNSLSGLGTWAGNLSSTRCAIAAKSPDPFLPFSGTIAHFALFNAEPTPAQIRQDWLLGKPLVEGKTLGILGDSISTSAVGWQFLTAQKYAAPVELIDHAVASQSILTHMAAQAAAAASDNADIVVVALGTNDDNAGNMTALQAAYEAGIDMLKATNPRATIYGMNVLPKWANNTTGAEVDKSNIRTAIAAACTAQGITCWDTYTDPWIAQNQTSDGTHPNAAGHAAIVARVLALL